MLASVFTFSMFLSAFLLFLVEPMIAKRVLPMLGGTPAVWNTCLVFFQAMLLAGYLYAHAALRWLRRRGLRLPCILRSSSCHCWSLDCCRFTFRRAWNPPAPEQSGGLGSGTATRCGGPAVFCAGFHYVSDAEMVCGVGTQGRGRPVFPLRRKQRRQPDRVAGLPAAS